MEFPIWMFFAGMGALGAGAVAFARNVVHCAFGLLFALLSVCAMYAMLGADFLAVTQVVVYVGGILVLVVFGVMMTHRIEASSLRTELVQPLAASIAAILVFGLSIVTIVNEAWPLLTQPNPAEPTTAPIGRAFLTDFLYPFEFASVLLLMAMLGAAMLTREKPSDDAPKGASSIPDAPEGASSIQGGE